VISEAVEVGDEVMSGIRAKIHIGLAGMRGATTAISLVVDDDAVEFGIEETPVPRGAS
jgi:hypothetical protein